MINFANEPVRAVKKPSHGRNAPKRTSISNLSPKEDKRLKERSNGVCERCDRARAVERAHIVRRHNHSASPVAEDYAHLCKVCHRWCDGSLEGREWLLQFQIRLREKDAG
jgi:hypothetical protein